MKKFNEFNKWSVGYMADDSETSNVEWLGDVYIDQIVRYFDAGLDENLESEMYMNIRECLDDNNKQLYIPESYTVWPRRSQDEMHVVDKGYYVFKDEGNAFPNAKRPRDIDDQVYMTTKLRLKPQSVFTINKEDIC